MLTRGRKERGSHGDRLHLITFAKGNTGISANPGNNGVSYANEGLKNMFSDLKDISYARASANGFN